MTLFTTRFKAPTTGNYQFRMDRKDDRHAMWLDLDQDGVFRVGPAPMVPQVTKF